MCHQDIWQTCPRKLSAEDIKQAFDNMERQIKRLQSALACEQNNTTALERKLRNDRLATGTTMD